MSSKTSNDTLERFDKLAEVLRQTSASIPQALTEERRLGAELGSAELDGGADDDHHGELITIRENRERAVRQRQAACQGLLDLEPRLSEERRIAEGRRAALAAGVIGEFAGRWTAAVEVLAQLHAESQELSKILRTEVRTQMPCRIGYSPAAADRPHIVFDALPHQPVMPALPPDLADVAGTLERLDAAAAVIGAIKAARQEAARHQILARERGLPSEAGGVFVVLRPFSHLAAEFAVGSLIDASVVPGGLLHRYQVAKFIRPVEGAVGAAA